MNNTTRVVSWIAIAALCAGAPHAQQTGGDCPDRQATQKPPEHSNLGVVNQCGIGVMVFGRQWNLPGRDCPETQVLIPAHGSCEGTYSLGSRCVSAGSLSVKTRHCECRTFGILGVGLSTPTCRCDEWQPNGGSVENMVTKLCNPPDERGDVK